MLQVIPPFIFPRGSQARLGSSSACNTSFYVFIYLSYPFFLFVSFFPSWLYFVGVSLFAVYISLLLVFGGAVLNGIDETITEAMNTPRFSLSLGRGQVEKR
jgi:hypothetical protein